MTSNIKARKRRWKFRVPHSYVIIVCILFFVSVMTYIVPAGEFFEETAANIGESFHYVERNPVPFWKIPNYIVDSLVQNAKTIFSILIITAAMEVILNTNMFQEFSRKLSRIAGKRARLFIPLILLLFSVVGITQQTASFIGFATLGVVLAYAMGYDAIVGVSLIFLGTSIGFATSIVSPLLALAQELAEVQIYSGMWLRIVAFVVLYLIAAIYISKYGVAVLHDREKSLLYSNVTKDDLQQSLAENNDSQVSKRSYLVLLIVLAGFTILIYGCVSLGWALTENAVLFFWIALLSGLSSGMNASTIAKHFQTGIKNAAPAAVIIGMGAACVPMMADGRIMDTTVHSLSEMLMYVPDVLKGPALLLINIIISFFITSGGGQASVVIPVLAPVVDICGVSRQILILSFRLADGISGCIQPHTGSLIAFLAAAGIPFEVWMKFMGKLFLLWTLASAILLVLGQAVGY